MVQLLRVCVLFSLIGFTAAATDPWTYTDPSLWEKSYPLCAGQHQSPICFDPEEDVVNRNLPKFTYNGWGDLDESGQTCELIMINNGHSLQVNVEDCSSHISGGGLSGDYHTSQYHFHWGEQSTHGSEHCIDDEYFPMELHVVHYKEEYGSVANALNYPDGLAVLGFFFKITAAKNSNYTTLISEFSKVPHEGEQSTIEHIPLNNFVSSDLTKFCRYTGSLTTPPCSEVVAWTVFKDPIHLSEDQIKEFRKLIESENFRPPQPINDRKVQCSVPFEDTD